MKTPTKAKRADGAATPAATPKPTPGTVRKDAQAFWVFRCEPRAEWKHCETKTEMWCCLGLSKGYMSQGLELPSGVEVVPVKPWKRKKTAVAGWVTHASDKPADAPDGYAEALARLDQEQDTESDTEELRAPTSPEVRGARTVQEA